MTQRNSIKRRAARLGVCALAAAWVGTFAMARADETTLPVHFAGGHKTDPRDDGRPVTLIAAALGVPSETFRTAFRGVTPARGGPPTREQVHRNKAALLKVLAPLGVTNERLDEVSDYYRYRPHRGELWRSRPAKAHAVVEDGKVKRIVVTDPGAGYSSPPEATISGMEGTPLTVNVCYGTDLKKNGSIGSIEIAAPKNQRADR